MIIFRVRKVEKRVEHKKGLWELLGAVCVLFLDFGSGFMGFMEVHHHYFFSCTIQN